MKKLTFLPTVALVALAAIFPAQSVELVKAETLDSQALTIQAKQLLTIEMQQMHVETETNQSLVVAINALEKQAKAVQQEVEDVTYEINLAD